MKRRKLLKYLAGILIVVGIILSFLYLEIGLFSILFSLIIFAISYYDGKKSSNKNSKEHEKIITIIQNSSGSNKKLESLKDILKKENINIRKTISNFDSPLWSIFVYKFGEQPIYSKVKLPKKLSEHLKKKLNFELVGNSFYFIPPNKMPKVNENFDIEKWTKRNIVSKLPKTIPYNIKWISLVDLRNVFAFKTTDYGETFFDVLLKKDKLFLEKLFKSLEEKKVAFKDLSKDWNLEDLITLKIDKRILGKIKRNGTKILDNLNCRNISELGDLDKDYLKDKMEEILEENLSQDLIENIKNNAIAVKEIQ